MTGDESSVSGFIPVISNLVPERPHQRLCIAEGRGKFAGVRAAESSGRRGNNKRDGGNSAMFLRYCPPA